MSTAEQQGGKPAAAAETTDDFEVRLRQLIKDFGNLVTDTFLAISGSPKKATVKPRRTLGQWLRDVLKGGSDSVDYKSVAAFTIIFMIVSLATALFFLNGPPSGSFDTANLKLPVSPAKCPKVKVTAPTQPAQVSPASGAGAIMNIFIGREGGREQGETAALALQKGSLCSGSILPMATSTFTRSDGATLQPSQLRSWAQVGGNGTDVTVQVLVAPHYGPPPGAGSYSGAVYLDNSTAQGAKVPVRIHVEYQNIKLVWAFSALAAFGGFIWAWLLHTAAGGVPHKGYFFRPFALSAAVVLAAAIPILNVQVLSKPDWQGSATQYIGLATLVGAAAIAATPTLRALVLPASLDKQKPGAGG